MRARFWLGGMALIAVALISWQAGSGAAPAPAEKAEGKSPSDDRDEFSNKLMERVTIEKPFEQVPLKEVLEYLSKTHDINLIVVWFPGNSPPAMQSKIFFRIIRTYLEKVSWQSCVMP
jgi:hypothetical protein